MVYGNLMASGQYSRIYTKKTRTLFWLYRERIARVGAVKAQFKLNILLFASRARRLSAVKRLRAIFLLQGHARAGYQTRLVRKCLNSGRTHFVGKAHLLARMQFRNYAHLGKLPGV
jgi:ribosomal protein S14